MSERTFEVDAAVTLLIPAETKTDAIEKAERTPLREWFGPYITESQVKEVEG